MGKSLFEKIAAREIPAYIIWENDDYMAFLDIMPLTKGQTLVVPKKNLSGYLFSLSDADYQALMKHTKMIAELLKDQLKVERVFMIVEGLEVPHVHVKLLPSNGAEISSMKRYSASEEELKEVFQKLVG